MSLSRASALLTASHVGQKVEVFTGIEKLDGTVVEVLDVCKRYRIRYYDDGYPIVGIFTTDQIQMSEDMIHDCLIIKYAKE